MNLIKESVLLFAAVFLSSSIAMAGGKASLFAPLKKRAANTSAVKINRDIIRGGGIIAWDILENEGSITLCDQPSLVNARVKNRGLLEVAYKQAVFTEDFINTGTVKTTDTVVRFNGLYQEDGVYISDPSDNYFWDLHIGDNGYFVGGAGDNFFIRGDFINSSTQNQNWSTAECLLAFPDGFRDGTPDPDHDFSITGSDVGPVSDGYVDNFAWGTLLITSSNTLQLLDGNSEAGGALYIGTISGLAISGTLIENISSSEGMNIYYRAQLPGNSQLNGRVFDFSDHGGRLIPIWPKSPDIDHDGDVDGADLALIAAVMNTVCPPMTACYCDLDNDRQVNETDLALFAPYFGTLAQ